MEFNIEKIDDITIVEILTEVIDASNAKEFRADIAHILDENKKLAFNMGRIKFLDSSGCGTILSCLRHLNSANGDLKVFDLQKPVRSLFELVRMHRIIEIFDTKEEAIGSF